MNEKNKLVVFQDRKIRRIWHNNEWYFSVVDVVAVLTDSPTPGSTGARLKTGNLRLLNCPQFGYS